MMRCADGDSDEAGAEERLPASLSPRRLGVLGQRDRICEISSVMRITSANNNMSLRI
jgi:hypothetical protein